MNKSRKKILIVTLVLILIAFAGGGVTLLLNKLFHLDTYKNEILAELQKALQRQVLYEKGDFSLRFGPSFVFTKVIVKEKDGSADFVTADRVTVKVALLPLLEKKLVLREIILDRPDIRIIRAPSGLFNISDLLEEKPEAIPLQIKGIKVRKGNLRYLDHTVSAAGLATSVEEADLSINRFTRGKTSEIRLSAFIADEGKRAVITLTGSVQLAEQDKPLIDSRLNLTVLAKNLNAGHYWPYYSRYVPFRKITGYLDIDSSFKGKLSQFSSNGHMRVSSLRFDYPQVFHGILTPQDLHFSYDMDLSPQAVAVKSLDLTVDGLNVKGGCTISDIHTDDPRITAHAVTTRFDLTHFAQYIPYGIIVKDPAEFIEQHIKGGIYKLDDGRLDGRVSQILHMERGDNYNVLFINGRVEQGLLSFGSKVPTFNSIKGTLEMRGKDFNLIGMSGKFGGSPFTLNGKIADYPLDSPSGYPFSMNMIPRQAEVAWLMGEEKANRLTFTGDSQLHLTGEGFTSGYNLSGDWNLTPASYSYPNIVNKAPGRLNLLSFKGSINKQEASLGELRYTLSPLSLALSAGYRFAGKKRLVMDITTNQFQVGEVATVVPSIPKYQLAGKVQAAVHGESPSTNLSDFRWSGDITFAGFSCKPSAQIRTVSNMTGTIHFNGNALETSQLTARIGNSLINGRGSMVGFETPSLNLVFSSPSLDMADFGLHSPQKEVKTGKVQGDITLSNGNLQIKSVFAQINKSVVTLKGSVQNLHNPKIDIVVASPHLEVEDVILVASLEPVTKPTGTGGIVALKAKVSAESGRFGDIQFARLTTVALYEEKKLYLQPLAAQILGGHCSGTSRIDFGTPGAPRYQVACTLENCSAERFMQAIGIKKQEVTGTLSMTGDITAKGKSGTELKQTALGSIKLRFEEGTLRKFSVLSKIFSILNVSQLLKLQLPDMVSGGMPYNEITATLSVRDGVVSSNDLYIDSDAMNISAVGSLDLVKEELNATVGVQPLQTVDKVVSHIPIVGWILTGKEKSFITTYFEAKGKIDNPSVSPIPVKSLGKGVFDIFKRVFQLPAKLFTDTGEVILGK